MRWITTRRRTLPLSVLLALLGTVVAACGTTSGDRGGSPFDAASGEGDQVQIEIQNRDFNDATVWAVTPGGDRRLGIVGGKTDQTYTLDWSRAQTLQLRISIQSGPTCLTRRLATDPGDVIQMSIDIDFVNSRACR